LKKVHLRCWIIHILINLYIWFSFKSS